MHVSYEPPHPTLRDTLNPASGIRGVPHEPVHSTAEHFTVCPICRQHIDMRDLGQVLYRVGAGHKPLPTDG
jgi:hypothetical protein